MRQPLTALFLALPLVACGGTTDPMSAAQEALSAGDYGKAAELLEGYVDGLEPTDPVYKDATIAYCEALADAQPDQAKTTFEALVAQLGDAVTAKDYRYVTSHLQTHKHYLAAVDLMDAGLKRFPGDEVMTQLKDTLIAAVQQAGDAEATAKLKGLGYL